MNKRYELRNDNYSMNLALIFGGIIIILTFYLIRMKSFGTVWELGDEAGYLWNAARLMGVNWDCIARDYSYYGFGYSLFLTPFFKLCSTGVSLLKCVYFLNIIFLIVIYIVEIEVLKLLFKTDSMMVYFVGVIGSLLPSMAANVYKVFCECFLACCYAVYILLIVKALDNRKYSVFIPVITVFMFFVHTRCAFIIVFTIPILIWLIKKDKRYIKQIILGIAIAGVLFIALYCLKNSLLEYKDSVRLNIDYNESNIVTADYITTRLKWFNPVNYFFCFLGKVLYTSCATIGLFVPTLLICLVRLKTKKSNTADIIISFICFQIVAMMIVCTMVGTGGDLRFAIYGRYYEFFFSSFVPLACFSLVNNIDILKPKWIFFMSFLILSIVFAYVIWGMSFFAEGTSVVDTNRLAAFSWALGIENQINSAIYLVAKYIVLFTIVFGFLLRKRQNLLFMISLVLLCSIYMSNKCLDAVELMHINAKNDTNLAQYIIDNDINPIIMIDDDSYRYPYYYNRIQVLIKDIPL